MDGKDPTGRKVGLLDPMHLMCFVVDPYSHEWRSKFKLGANLGVIATKMIETYIPNNDPESLAKRQRVKNEFMVRTNNSILHSYLTAK